MQNLDFGLFFRNSKLEFMKDLQAKPSFDHQNNKTRPVGILTKITDDEKKEASLRMYFGDLFRNPQVHLESNISIDYEKREDENVATTAVKQLENFVTSNPNFTSSQPILGLSKIIAIIIREMKATLEQDNKIKIECKTDDQTALFQRVICEDVTNNNLQVFAIEGDIKH